VVIQLHASKQEASMVTATTTEAIRWTDDVGKALAESKKSGKPALLDFTAAPM